MSNYPKNIQVFQEFFRLCVRILNFENKDPPLSQLNNNNNKKKILQQAWSAQF